MVKEEKSSNKIGWIVLIGIIAILVIAFIFVFVTVGYNVKICYTEKEPYQDIEYYTTKEPVNNQVCHTEQISWSAPERPCTGSFGFPETGARCFDVKCTINNKDSVGGTFKIQLKFWEKDTLGYFSSEDYEKELYINPFETALPDYSNLFCWPVDTTLELERMDINVIPPTKNVCEDIINYQDVQKSREITRYKDVPRERNEVRQCNLWKAVIGRCEDTAENC